MIVTIKKWLARHRWWALSFQLIIFIILIFAIRAWQLRDALTGIAPEIKGVLINQQVFELKQYRGQPALIYFWASWCPMCKMTNKNIENIAVDYNVISIASWSGNAMEIQAYLQEAELQMPVLADNEGRWAEQYAVKGVPAIFVLDAEGEIQFMESGYTTEYGLRMRLWWLAAKD